MTAREIRSVLPPSLPPRLLSRVEAAEYVGVSPTLFDALVRERTMPPPKRLHARVLWDRLRLDQAVAALPDDDDRAEAARTGARNPFDEDEEQAA